jgi:hypothetical protein
MYVIRIDDLHLGNKLFDINAFHVIQIRYLVKITCDQI